VADASAVVEFLLRTPRGAMVEAVLTAPDTDLHVPALCDIEVAAVLRRLSRSVLDAERRGQALADYADFPLTRHGHLSLLPRVLEMRDAFTAYDAAYVALAEVLEAGLLTADRRLARAVETHTGVTVLG
jgi:predicted nucleic acid-binding protein